MTEQIKTVLYPVEIVKDGETFRFIDERPGWLIYGNDEHMVLVGRIEAAELAPAADPVAIMAVRYGYD